MDQHTNKFLKDKLYREDWFPTSIYFIDHPTPEKTNSRLIKDITKWHDRDQEGIIRSNSLGWHSAVDMHHRNEYNHFTKWLITQVGEVFKDMKYHKESYAMCDNMWANINKRYSHNRNHTHPGALWSGVYYIQAPKDSGKIWFTDPRNEAHILWCTYDKKERPLRALREVYYEPIPGRLILFPGWLTHEVEPNLNKEFDENDPNGWRYSISFNFIQRLDKPLNLGKGHSGGGSISIKDLEHENE
jgi:uncharacterized protein (TIGR02466 family)